MIADLNGKIVFKCCTIKNDILDSDIDTADYVNCEEFWYIVEMNMIMKGLTINIPAQLVLKPSLIIWSPYMGKSTRSSNLMVNTEHRKVHKGSGEVEPDCRELCEE